MSQSSAFKSKRAGRWVTIRLKVLFSILITLICVFLVINFVIEPIITGNIAQQEKEDTEGKVRQAQAVLLNELSDLSNVAEGWASWDDTYAFAINNSEGYIKSNLHENTFINNRLNLILIANTDGRTVWGGTYDRIQSKLIPVPSVLLDCLTQLNFDSKAKLAGIITPGNEPLMIAVFPILTSKGEGPMHGRLIFGRSLDETEIEHLSRVSRLAIGILPLNAPDIPSEVLALPKSGGGEPVVIRPVDRNNIRGYSILDNIEGGKALVLSVDVSRTIYSSGQTMLRQFKMVLLVISGVYLLVSFALLELFVVSPIASLSRNVSRIQPDGGENRVPIRGNDEVATLGNSINQMLDKLDESRETLADSEEKYRNLVENAPVGISIAASDGRPIERNTAAQRMHGYDSKEEFMKMSAADFYYDVADWKRFIELAARVPVQDFEVQHKRKDGSSFWVSQTSIPNIAESSEQQFIVIVQDITERKKAEEALRTSEERFRNLVENAPIGISITTQDGRGILRNRAIQQMHGYESKEEFMKITASQRYYDMEDRKRLLELLDKQGKVNDFEVRLKRKDGALFWGSLTVIPEVTASGEKQLITITQDITERRNAEMRYATIIQTAIDGFWIIDLKGRFLECNDSYCSMIGYTREELLRMSIPDIEVMERSEETVKHINKIIQQGYDRFETKHRCKDGKIIDLEISAKYSILGKGQIFVFIRDITKRKQIEGENLLKGTLLDAATDSIVLRELNNGVPGRPVYANEAAYQTRGYTREEFMAISINELVVPEMVSSTQSHINDILIKGENVWESVHKLKDGTLMPVEIHAKTITRDQRNYMLSVVRDITRRKLAEEERNKLYQQEKELRAGLEEEIKKRTEFTRVLVHELKTPLTPVLASSELLAEELHEEPYLSLAKNIHRGAMSLNTRIDELLDLARGEIGMLHLNLKPVSPARLLREVFDYTAASALDSGVSISLEMPDFLPEVIADEGRLKQILMNFISNSIKFTESGGKVLIRAGVEGDSFVFQVRDTGHGIDEKEQERLFQPYYRLEGDRELFSGLGLGLALSKSLVELHGGKIWLESRKGSGSTFSFSIPFNRDAADMSKQESAL